MRDLKYSEILRLNREISTSPGEEHYNIVVLSNITIHQIKEILEYSLRIEGINARVDIGDYDNIIQDSLKYKDSNLVIIFWEACNIIGGLQSRIESFEDDQFNAIFEKTKSEIDLVLKCFKETSLVLFNRFSSLIFSYSNIRKNNYEKLTNLLNEYLESKKHANVLLVELDKVIADIGVQKSMDPRLYYSSKALYTINFFRTYVEYIRPFAVSANGKSKKVLVFDCDNTLWKGVLGEDGFGNIEMSSETNDGTIFSEIQSIALAAYKQGILIGLCSKNNLEDVEEVINSNPDMQLRGEHIAIKRCNWSDKVSNLKEIALELNIGLDTFVFVEDSPFEVNLVREYLPEITVLQVPGNLSDYPGMLRQYLRMFHNPSSTREDEKKTEMYKQQVDRESSRKEFANIEEYIASLGMEIIVYEDNESIIPRMAQMSMKTNQFNLTTIRFTETDIRNLVKRNDSAVFAFSLSDKFGESGITGLCIVCYDNREKNADINTFLMSCRIIGRNIEYTFMDYLINNLKKIKIETVTAKYVKTRKNDLVKDFYSKCSFDENGSSGITKNYFMDISKYKPKQLNYIKVIDGR